MLRDLLIRSLMVAVIVAAVSHDNPLNADELDLPAIAELHQNEAGGYTFSLDPAMKQPLELKTEPIFKWQNQINQGGQLGAIYVWTRDGRPEVVGSMFSQAEQGKRVVVHEFHTLAETVLAVRSPDKVLYQWKPRGTLSIKPLENGMSVAETAARRMSQMRAIARDFSAHTKSGDGRVELRLATQPMIRYQPTRGDVLDGALFALLSSASGTDPEVMLMIEARKLEPNSADWVWSTGIVRFTDRDLVVMYKDIELFSSIANPKLRTKIEDNYKWIHNSDDTYSVFRAKIVPELLKPATKP